MWRLVLVAGAWGNVAWLPSAHVPAVPRSAPVAPRTPAAPLAVEASPAFPHEEARGGKLALPDAGAAATERAAPGLGARALDTLRVATVCTALLSSAAWVFRTIRPASNAYSDKAGGATEGTELATATFLVPPAASATPAPEDRGKSPPVMAATTATGFPTRSPGSPSRSFRVVREEKLEPDLTVYAEPRSSRWRRAANFLQAAKLRTTLGRSYTCALLICALVSLLQTVSPAAGMPATLSKVLARWEAARVAHELVVTTVLSLPVYACCDIVSQTVEAQRAGVGGRLGAPFAQLFELSVVRFCRSMLASTFVAGFLGIFYFRLLACLPAYSARIAVDMCSHGVNTSIYLSIQALLRGDGRLIAQEIRTKVPTLWKQALPYWTLANGLTTVLVPVRLCPLVHSLFCIPWSVYLSSVANSKGSAAAPPPADLERPLTPPGVPAA